MVKIKAVVKIDSEELFENLLNVAPIRPIFVFGQPGIGKTAVINQFSREIGMECVSLLGAQLAPEDVMGVPKIVQETTRFYPPSNIKRKEPYILFLDELNASKQEVQKAFYSLILDQRVGEYTLPKGSIVVAAGNRAEDAAIVKKMSSALINRLVIYHMKVNPSHWLKWATQAEIHPWIYEYIQKHPNSLVTEPSQTEEPFSTPRSWHMLSDCLKSFKEPSEKQIEVHSFGTISAHHAKQFQGFVKLVKDKFSIHEILKGKRSWPHKPEDRQILHYLSIAFRDHLLKSLSETKTSKSAKLAFEAKPLLRDLVRINAESAKMVVAETDDGKKLPAWFLVEVVKDLPRLAQK